MKWMITERLHTSSSEIFLRAMKFVSRSASGSSSLERTGSFTQQSAHGAIGSAADCSYVIWASVGSWFESG